jgi:beta-lactam-binding protein with PASTA domain
MNPLRRQSSWPETEADTSVAPPPPPPPPAAPPGDDEPGNRIGMGMLLAIGVLAVAAAVLAAILLTRHHHHASTAPTTTVVVTTAPAAVTTVPAQPKKLILPVPDLVGQSSKAAAAGLRRAGFHVTFATVPSARPRGTVTAQDPAAGQRVAKGSDVRLNLSDGSKATTTAPQATTPQTTTAPQPTTTVAQTTSTPAPTTTPAQTTSTPAQTASTPAQTTSTPAQTTSAPTPAPSAPAPVPSLSGDLKSSLQQLDQAGFKASIAYVPSEQPLGTVVSQSPSGGATAKQGSQVTVNVAAGPNATQQISVPDVTGQTIPQAVSTLNQAGLRLILLKTKVSDKTQAGKVISQTPAVGKQVPHNAQVLVYMGAYSG